MTVTAADEPDEAEAVLRNNDIEAELVYQSGIHFWEQWSQDSDGHLHEYIIYMKTNFSKS